MLRQAETRSETQDWEILHNLGVCYTYLKEWEQAKELLRFAKYYILYVYLPGRLR